MSTSVKYKPRSNLFPRLIQGNQFQDAISTGSDILCTDTVYLDEPCMDTMYLYLNCGCVGDIPMISFLSDRTGRCDVQAADTQGVRDSPN